MIRRKTNRRHMTGDHHGRTAWRATLLVAATDEILGTHRATTRAKISGVDECGKDPGGNGRCVSWIRAIEHVAGGEYACPV